MDQPLVTETVGPILLHLVSLHLAVEYLPAIPRRNAHFFFDLSSLNTVLYALCLVITFWQMYSVILKHSWNEKSPTKFCSTVLSFIALDIIHFRKLCLTNIVALVQCYWSPSKHFFTMPPEKIFVSNMAQGSQKFGHPCSRSIIFVKMFCRREGSPPLNSLFSSLLGSLKFTATEWFLTKIKLIQNAQFSEKEKIS